MREELKELFIKTGVEMNCPDASPASSLWNPTDSQGFRKTLQILLRHMRQAKVDSSVLTSSLYICKSTNTIILVTLVKPWADFSVLTH